MNPRMDKPSTIQPGHPDFSVFLKGGQTVFVEMKVPGGVLSPEQIGRIEELRRIGHKVAVCWSALEAIEFIREALGENL